MAEMEKERDHPLLLTSGLVVAKGVSNSLVVVLIEIYKLEYVLVDAMQDCHQAIPDLCLGRLGEIVEQLRWFAVGIDKVKQLQRLKGSGTETLAYASACEDIQGEGRLKAAITEALNDRKDGGGGCVWGLTISDNWHWLPRSNVDGVQCNSVGGATLQPRFIQY
jgi:hypothetical protein